MQDETTNNYTDGARKTSRHTSNDALTGASGMRQEGTDAALSGKLRGGHDARELAQRRWEKQRAKEATADTSPPEADDEVRIVQCRVRVGRIIVALEREAVRGNANAARELRSWLSEYPPTSDAVRTEDLDRITRDRLLARLLAELDEEDAASERGR